MSNELFLLLIPSLSQLFLNFLGDLVHVVLGVLCRSLKITLVFEFWWVTIIWILILLIRYHEKFIVSTMQSLVVPLINILIVVIEILLGVLSVRVESSFVLEMVWHYFNVVFKSHLRLVYLHQVRGESIHLQELGNVLGFLHHWHWRWRPDNSHFVQA